MADPKKISKPPTDLKTAPWTAAIAKMRARPNLAGAIVRAEDMMAGRATATGDSMLDLADSLITSMVNLERCVAAKRMTPSAAGAKASELADWLGQLALPAPKPAAKAEQTAATAP